MQQLYLTGDGASASAAQLMNALNVPFSGFQLTPVRVGGSLRGEALHLLLPPPKPRLNDVLCRVRLTEKDWLLLPQVMEEIAAPGLCGTFSTRTPILIDRIELEMLACPAFCDALMQELDAPMAFSPGFRWGTSVLPGQPITFEHVADQTQDQIA